MVNENDDISFHIKDLEVLRFKYNGDILVKGRLVENDIEIVKAIKEFISYQFIKRG
jgi:hypothetical protein